MTEVSERPLLRVIFRLADGGVLIRDWTVAELNTGDPLPKEPPPWLDNPKREWGHPQDPVTFSGDVRPGHEDEAREMVK